MTDELLAQMYRHAEQEYPSECIGVVIGDPKDPTCAHLKRLTNVQDKVHHDDPTHFERDSRTGYFVDPKEVFDLTRVIEKKGLKILAFYHSHPDHESYFSQEDLAGAVMFDEPVYPDVSYIVISIFDGTVKNAKVFEWDGTTYSPTKDLKA